MIDLTDKVALVTGASRGIGRAVALQLARLGADVALNYQSNAEGANEVGREIERLGRRAITIRADVRDSNAVGTMVKTVVDRLDGLHILVNNAGLTRDNVMMRMKEEDWDLVLDTNLKGTFNVIKAAQRPMLKQKYGRIINVSSIAGVYGNAGQANYAASKAGLIGLTKTVAKELGSRNITCNAVAPGYIPTDLTASLPAEFIEMAQRLTPLGRMGTVEDVAQAVAFLASDAASFITAQVLQVDGGMVF
ncbi:MAG: 3-oxoacyl-[acyl-carrier-protein] reductase [Ardenticatenaceae bacterium]|nr:3-oxoacyl-[acyl-carrier-protein] reductase [Ardenticatenaceae bacterium]